MILKDLLYFFPSRRESKVIPSGKGEYVLGIATKFTRPDRRRANVEFIPLKRIPLGECEHHDGDILAWIGGCP